MTSTALATWRTGGSIDELRSEPLGEPRDHRAVGWYVHDGPARLDRVRAVAGALDLPIEVLTSQIASGELDGVASSTWLPDGDDLVGGGATAASPTAQRRPRLHHVLTWLSAVDPDVVVVDGSVDLALLVRMAGVPVVAVRDGTERRCPAEVAIEREAAALLASFPAWLESPEVEADVQAKTMYCGVLGSPQPAEQLRTGRERPRVVVLWPDGSPPPTGPSLDEAALARPEADWELIGPSAPVRPPTVARALGPIGEVPDLATRLAGADVVVGPPEVGVVGLAGAAHARLVLVPDHTGDGAADRIAHGLADQGAAVWCPAWPGASGWPQVLDEARGLGPGRWRCLEIQGSARRAATAIHQVLAESAEVAAG